MNFVPRYLSAGRVCCSTAYALCDKCKVHHHAHNLEANNMTEDFVPPNSYAPALQARAAAEKLTPEEQLLAFEEQNKADRLRALVAEHRDIAAHIAAAPQPRLTAAQVAEFAAPDPWAAGIRALQAKEAR